MARTASATNAGIFRLSWRSLRYSGNWIYLVPAFIFFIAYQIYPLIQVLVISFTDYHYLRNTPITFTGLKNYQDALADPLVWQGLGRSAAFTAPFLPGST